jgi:hypothetical protein
MLKEKLSAPETTIRTRILAPKESIQTNSRLSRETIQRRTSFFNYQYDKEARLLESVMNWFAQMGLRAGIPEELNQQLEANKLRIIEERRGVSPMSPLSPLSPQTSPRSPSFLERRNKSSQKLPA